MFRRFPALLRLELENTTSTAAGYSQDLKATYNTKRGLNFRYSKESQKIRDLQIDGRKGFIRTLRDESHDSDKLTPAMTSVMLDMPTRVYYSDPKNKEDLVAAYKDVILPLSAVKKQLTARDLEIAQKKKEHRYLGVWMFLCMLLGNQFVHFLHPVDREIPLPSRDEINDYLEQQKLLKGEKETTESSASVGG